MHAKLRLSFLFFSFCFFLFSSCQKGDHSQVPEIDYVELLRLPADREIGVISCDKPWEKELSFPNIITLPNKYIMYYIVYDGDGNRTFNTCYAESTDGINWVKPELGLVEFNGNKNNNIISKDFEGMSVEYKDGSFYLLTYAVDFGTYLYKSTDGLNFEKVETFKVPYCCDTQNQIIYNQTTDKWHIYLRSWYKSTNENIVYNHTDSLYRAVSLLGPLANTSELENVNMELSATPFWRWGEDSGIPPALSDELPMVLYNTSDHDYDIYNSCVHQYNDGTMIAYPIHYWHLPDSPPGRPNDGYGGAGMYYSNDGENFEMVTTDYVDPGNFWFEYALGHVETETELIHYYVKFNKSHGDPVWDTNNQIIARIHLK